MIQLSPEQQATLPLSHWAAEVQPRNVYERVRAVYLTRMAELRARRRVRLSSTVSLLFENHETVLAQLHEQLRAAGDFGAGCLQRELEDLRPLLPQADSIHATLMVDDGCPDAGRRLSRRICDGEPTVSLQLGPHLVTARAVDAYPDPHCPVHHLRFTLGTGAQKALPDPECGAALLLDDGQDVHSTSLSALTRTELARDMLLPRPQSVLKQIAERRTAPQVPLNPFWKPVAATRTGAPTVRT